jgi:hypothetical protein
LDTEGLTTLEKARKVKRIKYLKKRKAKYDDLLKNILKTEENSRAQTYIHEKDKIHLI